MNDVTAMPKTAVVLGAGSDLSRAILRALAGRRLVSVLLAGRSARTLEGAVAELRDLSVPKVEVEQLDVTEIAALESFADSAARRIGDIDLVLIAAGELDMADLTTLDAPRVASLATTNFTGPAAAMTAFARVLRVQGHGRLVVLSSVAGYRVRAANFVYGAAKAGLDGFALGLGDALAGSGVTVMVVRPGFVRTKMTAGRKPTPLAVDATDVADAVVRGLETGAEVVWVPSVLRYVFGIFRLLPRPLWRRVPG
ncbi:MAG: SDR family NAD(P)-dependent oxidoreductase [Acidimicrobiales bacterium]|jgi:decaprenylphospho-beta-D-erythro-pentofuranosid-2-ulose 2-reductase